MHLHVHTGGHVNTCTQTQTHTFTENVKVSSADVSRGGEHSRPGRPTDCGISSLLETDFWGCRHPARAELTGSSLNHCHHIRGNPMKYTPLPSSGLSHLPGGREPQPDPASALVFHQPQKASGWGQRRLQGYPWVGPAQNFHFQLVCLHLWQRSCWSRDAPAPRDTSPAQKRPERTALALDTGGRVPREFSTVSTRPGGWQGCSISCQPTCRGWNQISSTRIEHVSSTCTGQTN